MLIYIKTCLFEFSVQKHLRLLGEKEDPSRHTKTSPIQGEITEKYLMTGKEQRKAPEIPEIPAKTAQRKTTDNKHPLSEVTKSSQYKAPFTP